MSISTGNRSVASALAALMLGVSFVGAQAAPATKTPVAHDQPVEVSSDKLDVFQEEHKAIFTGNVLAVQGTTQMRADQMVVFYADTGKPAAPPAQPAATEATTPKPTKPKDEGKQGITRIEATGSVVFTTPTETAQGDMGIYNVQTNTIDLIGKTVTLTREQNVLKGTKLNYNMDTGRSVLTGSGGAAVTGNEKGGRVHGLFVPQSSNKTIKP